jgi:NADH:ubiquinone oxidoreductase subunit C
MSEGAVTELRFDSTLLELRTEDGWEQKNGSWWIAPETLDPRAMTQFMLAHNARFVTVTAIQSEGGETRLNFHWDVKGTLLTFSAITHENRFVSISDLCIAADWVEREVHEYFGVDFIGRDNTKPLMLRPGLEIGLNRREDAKS